MKERENRAEELLTRAQEETRRLREHVEALTTLSRLRRRRDGLHADDTLRWLEGWQARRRGHADHAVITEMLEEYRQRRLASPPGEAPVSAEFREKLAEFTAANDELLRKLGDRPPGQHEDWCGDASLSRPDDKCTCAITPAVQRGQNAELEALLDPPDEQALRKAASGDLSALAPWERDLLLPYASAPPPGPPPFSPNMALVDGQRRRLAFAGIGASQPEPPARHEARRGDAVEAWLRRDRDALLADSADWAQQAAAVVDDLLEDYRLHADTGTPLDAEVSER